MFSKKPGKTKTAKPNALPRVSSKSLVAINETMEMPETPQYMRPAFKDVVSAIKERDYMREFERNYTGHFDPYDMDRRRMAYDERQREEEVERQIRQIIDILNYAGEPKLGRLVHEMFDVVKDISRRHSRAESRAWEAERDRSVLQSQVDALRESPTAVSLGDSEKISRARDWCVKNNADVKIVNTGLQTIFMFADKTTASKFKLMYG